MDISQISWEKAKRIPVIADVERNIDGYLMMRCSYLSIQSDEPIADLDIETGDLSFPVLLINMEAIILGTPGSSHKFASVEEIEQLYDYVDGQDHLFIDINDVWIPSAWFGKMEIVQGMLFRMPVEAFNRCWKLRNDRISSEEMFADEDVREEAVIEKYQENPRVIYSEEESMTFFNWTTYQIEESRRIYKENKDESLQKIKE